MRKKRLLVIDDEPDLLTIFQGYMRIKAKNYVVDTALNGVEGLEFVKNNLTKTPFSQKRVKIDAIICDISMPQMNGIEFVKLLRNFEKHEKLQSIPVIMLTGLEDIQNWKELTHPKKGQIADYILKPIDERSLEIILSSLDRILNKGELNNLIQETQKRGVEQQHKLIDSLTDV